MLLLDESRDGVRATEWRGVVGRLREVAQRGGERLARVQRRALVAHQPHDLKVVSARDKLESALGRAAHRLDHLSGRGDEGVREYERECKCAI